MIFIYVFYFGFSKNFFLFEFFPPLDRLRSLSFDGPYEIQDNWAYKKPGMYIIYVYDPEFKWNIKLWLIFKNLKFQY